MDVPRRSRLRLPGETLRGWRRVATAAWDGPNDPQVFGALDIDGTALRAFMQGARAAGHHVTPTHLAGRAVAHALAAVPDLNVRLLAGRAFPRPSIDVFFIAAIERGRDLSGVKVERADQKSAVAIAAELDERGRALKQGKDPSLARAKATLERLPMPLLHVALRLGAWVTGDLALNIPQLGLLASPFGSAMVTSVGMLGIPHGFAPLMWMYRVPLLVLVGEMSDKPVAIDGRVEVRPMLPITATIDHRYVDGAQIAKAMRAFRKYLEAPAAFEPALGPARARV
jgi:pyruvate dehydrogenase E2 component (dihydrolipoamide acetyltransferase)